MTTKDFDIPFALSYLRPNEEWTLHGDDYGNLEWISDTAKPTEDDLRQAYSQAMSEMAQKKQAEKEARGAAIAHAKSLGFTDAMIAVIYPNLGIGDESE